MAEERAKRKLSAILSADVKGYSCLMGEDELATIETLKNYREIMAALINRFQGRVVDSPGDNVLAEFSSVVDALDCSVEIQKELKQKNEELLENRRMEFRIGVNLGDVVEDGERIYGDGVNIAARVESLAEGGGICISGTAFDQIGKKLPLGYEYLGEQTVKNIEKPVRVYRVLTEPEAAGKVIGEKRSWLIRWQWAALAVVVVLLVGVLIWIRLSAPPTEVASVDKMAFPLPDKPSIAVLPFENLSRDLEQEYFADGMTDDLITDLSKISGLFVIARNSAFTYKGKPVKIRQVAEELGVRYVLEGSVRKADDRVRINAQLIDATTGGHLWAERYDGKLGDIFALQDKVTQKIVAALAVKLTAGEEQQITRKGTENIAAYDAFLQGWQHYRRITRDDLAKAATHLKKAIELDPNYGRAHAALAAAYWLSYRRGWSWEMDWPYEVKSKAPLLAHEHLEKALKSPTSLAHQVASWMLVHEPLYEEAIAEAERAIALNPNDIDNLFAMARALIFGGRAHEGADYVKKAMRLDPHYPAQYLSFLGLAQFCMGQLEEAAITLERAHKRNPELEAYPLVVTYAHLGREEEAADLLAEYLRKTWEGRKDTLRGTQPRVRWVLTYYPFKNQADTDRFADGLRKVGLPLKRATYTFVLDPYCKSAYELMAYAHLRHVWFGWSKSPARSLELAWKLAQKAVTSAESSPEAHAVLGLTYLIKREHEKAIAEGERAVALGPNNTAALLQLAWTLRHTGRPEEAIALEKKAIGLHPWGESAHFHNLGMAYFTARRYEEAISAFKKALEKGPENQFAYMGLAAAYTYLGREEKARPAAAELLRIDPTFSLDHYAKILPFKNQEDKEHLINALRKAGLK
jgi:TolB-like protein/class 3 adenylate cyclase/cytochrome c-type biogenesis protein CcmH/NrfG